MRVALLVFSLLLAGCAAPAASDTPGTSTPAALAGPVSLAFDAPVLLGGSTHGAEPQVLVAPDGDVFVHHPLQLWRSRDGGATFEALGEAWCDARQALLQAPGCIDGEVRKNPGLFGVGDGALVSLPNGALLWAGLVGGGARIPFQTSADDGASWSEPVEIGEPNADREWLLATDGLVLATWRVANEHVATRASHDNGSTWGEAVQIQPDAIIGPPVALPDGAIILPLYAMFGAEGAQVARSEDAGATWKVTQVSTVESMTVVRNGGPSFAMPVAAVDGAGTLYMAWSSSDLQARMLGVKAADVPTVFMARSLDGGLTWSAPVAISDADHAAVLPWMVAGTEGRVALAWYENERGTPSENVPDAWRVRVSVVTSAQTDSPSMTTQFVSPDVVHLGSACTDGSICLARERPFADFLGLGLTADDRLVVAYAGNDGVPGGPIHIHAARTSAAVGLR